MGHEATYIDVNMRDLWGWSRVDGVGRKVGVKDG